MGSKRSLLLDWAESGRIPRNRIDRALSVSGLYPDSQSWRRFIDRLLLWSGILALAFSVIFFLAYNWDAMGRFAKFALVECLIVAALAGYWKLGRDDIKGRVALMLAAILLGALLALFGQTYQTGADPWQLFAGWALLILPWVLVGRFPALWVVWLALINLSLLLFFSVFPKIWGLLFSAEIQLYLTLAVNTLALAIWETRARHSTWLDQRWATRLLAVAGGFAVTLLMTQTIFDWQDISIVASIVYPLWIGGLYYVYRYQIQDLFMLAGGCLSMIVIVTSLLTRALLEDGDPIGFLLIALAVIGMSAAAGIWLKHINREFAS
ncbi:MAG: DUF2157 domain-containing protein [Gammaproteobacteria bacterium]|nr:DUF2157 domain-containing protein [Gammaproteobacteria bacterium]